MDQSKDRTVVIDPMDLYSIVSPHFPTSAGIPVDEAARLHPLPPLTEEEEQRIADFLAGIVD